MFGKKKSSMAELISNGALAALAPVQFPSIARIPGDLQSILTAADEASNKPVLSIVQRGNSTFLKMRDNLTGQRDDLTARIARDSEDLRQVNLMLAALDKGLDTISNDVALVPVDHAS